MASCMKTVSFEIDSKDLNDLMVDGVIGVISGGGGPTVDIEVRVEDSLPDIDGAIVLVGQKIKTKYVRLANTFPGLSPWRMLENTYDSNLATSESGIRERGFEVLWDGR